MVWRYATRDVTKNVLLSEAPQTVDELLRDSFRNARLFTTSGDWQWRRGRPLKAQRPTFTVAPSPEHDRAKRKLARLPELEDEPRKRGAAQPTGQRSRQG